MTHLSFSSFSKKKTNLREAEKIKGLLNEEQTFHNLSFHFLFWVSATWQAALWLSVYSPVNASDPPASVLPPRHPSAPRVGFFFWFLPAIQCHAAWLAEKGKARTVPCDWLDVILCLLSRGMLKYCIPTHPPPVPPRDPQREKGFRETRMVSRAHISRLLFRPPARVVGGSRNPERLHEIFFFSPQFFSFVMFYAAAPSWSLWYFSFIFIF